jgi:tagaturonate epimerase
MQDLSALLTTELLLPAFSQDEGRTLAEKLSEIAALDVYWRSIAAAHKALFFLGKRGTDKVLAILYAGNNPAMGAFAGDERDTVVDGQALKLRLCPTTYAHAVALHALLPFTQPRPLGLATSAGCGDRLGLATPGHVWAIRNALASGIAPIFTQQSIREMERSERTPKDVVNDGTWGVFQEGWRNGYGADADHLKSTQDVDVCVEAGFTFYTFDPREHVDNDAHTDGLDALGKKFAALPWDRLDDDAAAMQERYLRTFPITADYALSFTPETLLRAACKYGRALAHVAELYRYLAQTMDGYPFEVEVSVDETDTTTSPEEHFFIASELRRLGVEWVSLAPRYVGRFEKGVDYIGDLDAFDAAVAKHAAVARCCGGYKLSIHSGSDKFSIYPLIAKHTQGLVHLKTAGTSYLEALRAIAEIDSALFREILVFSFARYDEDKATYHVSADPSLALRSEALQDDQLTTVLDNFHNRQMLHVTFGSVLTTHQDDGSYLFKDRFFAALRSDEEAYYRVLETHFDKHLASFK